MQINKITGMKHSKYIGRKVNIYIYESLIINMYISESLVINTYPNSEGNSISNSKLKAARGMWAAQLRV